MIERSQARELLGLTKEKTSFITPVKIKHCVVKCKYRRSCFCLKAKRWKIGRIKIKF